MKYNHMWGGEFVWRRKEGGDDEVRGGFGSWDVNVGFFGFSGAGVSIPGRFLFLFLFCPVSAFLPRLSLSPFFLGRNSRQRRSLHWPAGLEMSGSLLCCSADPWDFVGFFFGPINKKAFSLFLFLGVGRWFGCFSRLIYFFCFGSDNRKLLLFWVICKSQNVCFWRLTAQNSESSCMERVLVLFWW